MKPVPLILNDPPLNPKQVRQLLGLSQVDLAEALSVTPTWWNLIEHGKRIPSRSLRMALLAMLLTRTESDRVFMRNRLRRACRAEAERRRIEAESESDTRHKLL